MTREKAIVLLECSANELVGTMMQTEEPSAVEQLQRYVDAYNMAISAMREQKYPCAACGYGGKHLDAPPCTTCPAHPKLKSSLKVLESNQQVTEPLCRKGFSGYEPLFAIKNQVKSDWISVEERLPDIADTYLVAVKFKYEWEQKYTICADVASFDQSVSGNIDDYWNIYNDWDEGQQCLHVTHWMPLPEPPKEEER